MRCGSPWRRFDVVPSVDGRTPTGGARSMRAIEHVAARKIREAIRPVKKRERNVKDHLRF